MATTPTLTFGLKNKILFKPPILEIGALLTDTYFQETPRSIHAENEEYVGIDIFPGQGVDHVINLCDENQIPEHWTQNGGYFNTIHCHCVMENVTDIFAMARNIEKITKVGGVLYITVPFSWKIHRIPLDMWRFTPQSIDFLFSHFEFKTDLCCSSTRKKELYSINDLPELNMGKGLAKLNPIFRFLI